MIRFRRFASAVLVAALCVPLVQAFINANFTPVHLVKGAELILSVDLEKGPSKDHYFAKVREVIKGKTTEKSLRLNLSRARDEQSADALRQLAARGKPALFFVAKTPGNGGAAQQSRGLLHIGGKWAVFDRTENGVWAFDNIDTPLQAVWAGGTDMLRRAVDYILQDEDAYVPVSDGVSWRNGAVKVAALDGAITAVRPIDLAGDGKLALFAACEKGDRCFAWDGKDKKFADLTPARGLQSKSKAFAWGDFAGQGRLDLISFDGKALALHAQQADGKFKAQPLDLGKSLEHGCVALTALDVGVKGRSGLLVTGNSWPVVVALDAEGKASSTVLSAPNIDLTKLGKAGASLVADLDGDGFSDVLALREGGSVLFRGVSPGKFAEGVACAVKLGKAPGQACLGDFDGDGRLDVLCVNTEGTFVWQNEGEGKFTETVSLTGELAYGAERGGIDCMAGDINNDGRQDVMLAYSGAAPRFFFNRGFRCFGFAATLNLGWDRLLPAAKEGQQSACLGDWDGDGAQDLALALPNGEIWVAFRGNGDGESRLAVAALPLGGNSNGPVTVTGWIGKRCLGAWNVLPGVSSASFGRTDEDPVTLKWRLPGGKPQQKEVTGKKRPVEVVWLDDRHAASDRQETHKTPPAQPKEKGGGKSDGPQAVADETVVLDHSTLWRFFRVRDAVHVRHPNGDLARAALSWSGHEWQPVNWDANGTSPAPPADWAGPDFDDSAWPRERLPQPSPAAYQVSNQSGSTGSINQFETVAVLTRAKFTVTDPAKVKSCRLSMDYWGGFIVYVNGREAVRRNLLPGGKNLLERVAEDYPLEAWTAPTGKPIVKQDVSKFLDRLAKRDRRQRDLEIPAEFLRAGQNVVAIEMHMAPIDYRAMAEYWQRWAPIALFAARLSVLPAGTASPSRPAGVHVWNCAAYDTATVFDSGDTTAPIQPIVVRAARNSAFSGRLMIGSDKPIRGLTATVSDLTQGDQRIPASAVRVRFAVPATANKSWAAPYRFDGLLDAIPAEIPVSKVSVPARDLFGELRPVSFDGSVVSGDLNGGAVAPLWLTVRVPKTAAPGTYEGTVTVSAEGLPPTAVKLRVNVCDWVMPDPKDFRIQNFLYEAEEVVGRHYGVPNYSDRHLELVGKSLALLAEVNSRQVQTNLSIGFCGRANPESLVRWIKQPDGSYKHDFTPFDKFLEMVGKSIGTPNTLRLNCWGGPVTVLDPATGKLTSMNPPEGEEGYRFWKPVFDEILKKVKARGWLEQTTLGCNIHSGVPSPAQVDFAHKLWPEGTWSWTSHAAGEGMKFKGSATNLLMTVRHADGVWMVTPTGKLPPLWALDGPRPITYCNTVRHVVNDNSAVREVRRLVEFGALLSGYDGVSEFGADVFPLPKAVGGYYLPEVSVGANWGNSNSTMALLYPGPEGPVATERFEMFREGVELCEAILFVRGAIHRNLLSPPLKERAERDLGERHQTFAQGFFMPRYMQAAEDAKLLDLAGEVARELDSRKK
jgi:hypothetical protein